MSIKFLYCYIKIHLFCLTLQSLPRYDFISYSGHLENVGSLGFQDLPNLLISLPILPEIPFSYQEPYHSHYRFSKVLIFARKLRFYHRQKILLDIFLEATDSLPK